MQISYGIGLADPLSVFVDSYGTSKNGLTDNDLQRIVQKNFDLRPGKIIQELQLKRPFYSENCTYGHFMKREMPWEITKKLK